MFESLQLVSNYKLSEQAWVLFYSSQSPLIKSNQYWTGMKAIRRTGVEEFKMRRLLDFKTRGPSQSLTPVPHFVSQDDAVKKCKIAIFLFLITGISETLTVVLFLG